MKKRRISTGSEFEKLAGYSRAIVQGDWCFVSGTTGYDYDTMQMPESVEEQTQNCLNTIESVLQEAGFQVNEIVRANYYVVSEDDCDRVFPILGNFFSDTRPAATMIVCGLCRPEMKIEIEVTALRDNGDSDGC